MGKINVGRWILGGVVAAVILFVVDWVVNGIVLMDQWAAAMADLGRSAMGTSTAEIVTYIVYDLVLGLAAIWIYAGIRPRFGAGMTTATYAGLVTWLLAFALPGVFMMSVFPANLVWTTGIVGLVQMVVATVVGAFFYKEDAAA